MAAKKLTAPLAAGKRGEIIERATALVVQLVSVLAPLVSEELRGDRSAPLYSTESPSMWPPRCRSRRHARDRIRAVPGHERIGHGRDTVWTIDREAYDAHHRYRPVVRVPRNVPAMADLDAMADRALQASGLRTTRGGS